MGDSLVKTMFKFIGLGSSGTVGVKDTNSSIERGGVRDRCK